MYDPMAFWKSAQTWAEFNRAYARMMFSAAEVIQTRTMQMALGTMKPEEATRMVLEKPAAFAKSFEMAMRATAASHGTAAAALAAVKPIGQKTASNARRLRRSR